MNADPRRPRRPRRRRRVSLFTLNEDCLRSIIDYLQLEDCVNLAESSGRLKRIIQPLLKKHSSIFLDAAALAKGSFYIQRLFFYVGCHTKTLTIDCRSATNCKLTRIVNQCTNLNSLRIDSLEVAVEGVFIYAAKLRLIELKDCDLSKLKPLMEKCSFLESLHIWNSEGYRYTCSEDEDVFEAMMLRNNQRIKSLALYKPYGSNFPFRLLTYTPNIERLAANYFQRENNFSFDSLANFKRLTCLRLFCFDWMVDDLLNGLANIGILEQLELNGGVILLDSAYEILRKFKKLQLLVIVHDRRSHMPMSTVCPWPPNLKRFCLSHYEISINELISTIEQLPNLESFDVQHSHISGDERDFQLSKGWIQRIEKIIDRSGRKQRLDVVLPHGLKFKDLDSEKYVFESQRLRILPWSLKSNQLNINIDFCGWHFDPNDLDAEHMHEVEIKLI